jgi:hypothetical protein
MKLSLLITILLSSLLFACTSEEVKDDKSEVRATFIGTIEEINDYNAQVLVIESEGINQISGLIAVDFSVNPDETFQVGDKVKVGYDGNVMETAPVQINTLTLEKVE